MENQIIESGVSIFLFNGAGLLLLGYLAKRSLDGLDERLDVLSVKIERLIEGRIEFVTKADCRMSVARLLDNVDALTAGNAELKNRISLMEGRFEAHLNKGGR